MPRLTVDIIHFQRQFAAAHILPLQLEAVDGVAVGVELELTAAEGDFLITFGIVEGIEHDRRLAVAAVGDACIDGKGSVAFGDLEQRLAGIIFHQRGVDRGHRRRQIKGF